MIEPLCDTRDLRPLKQPVILVTNAFPPENLVGALRPGRFAKYLPQFGYEPYVVTSSPQPEPAANVLVVPFRYTLTERLLSRTIFPYDERYTWVRPAVEVAATIVKQHGARLVLSTSPSVSTHLVARHLQRAHGLKWVADFRDPLVGNFSRVKFWGQRVDGILEKVFAHSADLLILNTEALVEKWRSRYPGIEERLTWLPNGFDPEDRCHPLPIPPRRHKVWIHAGSLYSNRYPERLIRAVDHLHSRQSLPELRLRFIGMVQDVSLMEQQAFRNLEAGGVLDCTWSHLPKAEARREMEEADGGIVFDHYHEAGNVQIPAKVYDCICIGRPILAFTSRSAPLDRVLEQCGIGNVRIYEDDQPAEIERKVVQFAGLPNDTQRASEYFQQRFNAAEQTRALAALFDSLIG